MGKFKDYRRLFKCFCNSRKTWRSGLFLLCILLVTPPVASAMTSLGDGELATVSGGMGVSIAIPNGTVLVEVGSFRLWESDPDIHLHDTGLGFDVPFKDSIELKNIVWDNGSGGGYSVATPAGDPVTFDIGTYANGRTYLNIHDSTNVSPRTFSSDLSFCDTDLGSLKVSNIVRTENNVMIGAHGGVDFQYWEKIDIGYAQYGYRLGDNPATIPVETRFVLEALTFTGIHLSETATGDPRYPTGHTGDIIDPINYPAWGFSGAFKIGDIAGANPAQIDIGTDASGVTSIRYELPMAGSIRMENVTFGVDGVGTPVNFGPLALDGLNVHRLAIQFHP